MQHPVNDYKRWRHDWAEVNRLVNEINRMLKLHWSRSRPSRRRTCP
jgi:hypothetical protein